jgi:cytochrome c-type biogenesis protein CcmH
MIWLAILVVAAVALAPLSLVLRRAGAEPRGGREAALALHRAQLEELDRDLTEARIAPAEHAAALLEIQRRLLAASGRGESAPPPATRVPVVAALVLVPAVAFALYLVGGSPRMPAEPLALRIAAADAQARDEARLIDQLRTRLAALDPRTDQAGQGYRLLGNAEASRGNWRAAAYAWQQALESRFDPTLAAEAAEAATQADGAVSAASAALFRRALAGAPADAPWRATAERRVAEAGTTSGDSGRR